MIPQYSPGALRAKSFFLQYRNSIDIYTEDKVVDKEFYKSLLNRVIDGNGKINDIFPLGPKSHVITQCENDFDTSRKKLYIVDADLDLITSANKQIKNLYVLDVYCIENFLIDERAAIEVIWYFVEGLDKAQIADKLQFNAWLNLIKTRLIDLFIHLAVLRELINTNLSLLIKFALELKSAHDFLKDDKGKAVLDLDKVNLYIQQCKANIIQCHNELGEIDAAGLYEKNIADKKHLWPDTVDSLIRIVSGKVYLLPLLQFRMSSLAQQKVINARSSIKKLLVTHCELTRMAGLKAAIIHAMA